MLAVKHISSIAQSGPTLSFPGPSTGRSKGARWVVRTSRQSTVGSASPVIELRIAVSVSVSVNNNMEFNIVGVFELARGLVASRGQTRHATSQAN